MSWRLRNGGAANAEKRVRVGRAGFGESVRTCDVVHHDGDGRVADVRGNERAEAFLAGGVPQLQPYGAVLQVHGFREEINADGCLPGGFQIATILSIIAFKCTQMWISFHFVFLVASRAARAHETQVFHSVT